MEIGNISVPAERSQQTGELEALVSTSGLTGLLSPFVLKQLELLNINTSLVSDEERAIGYAKRIFSAYPDSFSEEGKSAILQGTVLSDIGKAGSPRMCEDERELVLRMYAVENVPEGHGLTVANFLRGVFRERQGLSSEQGRDSVWQFGAMLRRLDPFSSNDPEEVGMSEFWSKGHLVWTMESIVGCNLPPLSVHTAGLHHRLEEIDPFDGSVPIGLPVALVAILDKYQAFRERSKLDHTKTLGILYQFVECSTVALEEKHHYLQTIGMTAVLADEI